MRRFWLRLRLTPAYDICPQSRTGNEATQAMLILGNNRLSSLDVCLAAARQFHLSDGAARTIIDRQIGVIRDHWDAVCEEARLTAVDRSLLWERQLLNPFALGSWPG